MDIVIFLLNILGAVLLVRWMVLQIRAYRQTEHKRAFFSLKRFRNAGGLAAIIGGPLVVVQWWLPAVPDYDVQSFFYDPANSWWIAVLIAFCISAVWLMYVRQLDIYEPERWGHLIAVFALSCVSTMFLAQWLYELVDSWGFYLDQGEQIWNDVLYCIFAIGGIEELTKILPVAIVLIVFRKAINEPYDYLLYGSVSALGFAFIENISYIHQSGLYNIGGRALYAAVAHMTFTSTVCYGLMLWRFKFTKWPGWIVVPFFFFLAMGTHGFYDFWLLNFSVVKYSAVTTVFFLITIHLWFTMKNNAINVSNFYSPKVSLNNDRLRFYLIISLTALLMLAYILVALMDGTNVATSYLLHELLAYGYLVFYLAFGVSRFKIVPDRWNPFRVPFSFIVPRPRKEE